MWCVRIRSAVIKIIICMLGAALLVVVLNFSATQRLLSIKNGFNRRFKPNVIAKTKALNIRNNSYYLAGMSGDSIFLGNYRQPDSLLVVGKSMNTMSFVDLAIPTNIRIAWRAIRILVKSNHVVVSEGITPNILVKQFSDTVYWRSNSMKPGFVRTAFLAGNTVVTRRYDLRRRESYLVKEQLRGLPGHKDTFALETQVDGNFCTDGTLYFDAKANVVYYIYFYRNEYVALDTNMNLLHRGHTIDTNRVAKVKIDTIESENKITLAPITTVNESIGTSHKYLFVISGLISDNESRDEFSRNAVIDVYSSNQNGYLFSFYIPKERKEKIYDLIVDNNNVFVISGHTLFRYSLRD